MLNNFKNFSIGVALVGVALYAYAVYPTPTKIVFQDGSLLQSILNEHREIIGADFTAYRNHCMRVYNLVVLASQRRAPLNGLALEKRDEVLQIAVAFHDIGLWTDDTVAYLEPSEKRAVAWLKSHHRASEVELVTALIEEHHKITPYKGPHADLVTDFLQADWSDVMLGLIAFGRLTRGDVRAVQDEFVNAGFHMRLGIFGFEQMKRDPFNPLPMFKL